MSSIETDGLQKCPVLRSKRLWFKPIKEENIGEILYLLSDYETVLMMTYAPWPYTLGDAITWINHVNRMCISNVGCFWGIHDENNTFIGTVGLSIFPEHDKAELHYWLGKKYWGIGYGTETAVRAIQYAFDVLKVERLEVNHMVRNIRSQRVIEKNKFTFEGVLRNYIKRFGEYEDVKIYSILRKEYIKNNLQ